MASVEVASAQMVYCVMVTSCVSILAMARSAVMTGMAEVVATAPHGPHVRMVCASPPTGIIAVGALCGRVLPREEL